MKVEMIKSKDYFQSDDFGIWVMKEQEPRPFHTHNFDELVFVLGGTAIHYTDNDEYPLVRGDVFVLRGRHAHGFKDNEKLHLVNILYNREHFSKTKKEFAHIDGFQALFVYEPKYRYRHKFETKLHLTTEQIDEVLPLLKMFNKELTTKHEGYKIAAESIFRMLVLEVSRFYSKMDLTRPKELYKITTAIRYMEKNFAEHISVPILANLTGMNRSAFYRAFKKITGSSPIEFLVRIRVKKAASMLSYNTEMHITDALAMCGFDNSSYFTRQFKSIMGITPREFVKKNRAAEEGVKVGRCEGVKV